MQASDRVLARRYAQALYQSAAENKRERETAGELAGAAGVAIDRIVTITFAPRGPMARGILMADASSRNAGTPIEAGQIPVEAEVRMVFMIKSP